jgi:hypothetical protein
MYTGGKEVTGSGYSPNGYITLSAFSGKSLGFHLFPIIKTFFDIWKT